MTIAFEPYLLAVCAAIAAVGYGFGLARLGRLHINLGDAGILGLFCFALLGFAAHFLIPLSSGLKCVVLALGLIGAFAARGRIREQLSAHPALWIAVLSAFFHRHALTSYDNGLYHLQTFKWNSELSILPGLANLHGRLAFNSSLFVIAPLSDRAGVGWIPNLLLCAFVLCSFCARLSHSARGTTQYWFLLIALALAALIPRELNWLGVFNADGFAALLIIYWFALALSIPADKPRATVIMLVITAALAATMKLSAAPLAAFTVLILFRYRRTLALRADRLLPLAGIFLALWMARGLTLSGCAIYPVSRTCVSVLPWAVPPAQAAAEASAIRSWARWPGRLDFDRVIAEWTWIPGWAARSYPDWNLRLLLIGSVAALLALPAGARPKSPSFVAAAALGLCLLFWFAGAPDVRFGNGYLAASGILGLSMAGSAWFSRIARADKVLPILFAASILIGAYRLAQHGNSWQIDHSTRFTSKAGPGGRHIWTPVDTDRCWAHSLPCTPYFDPEALKRIRWPSNLNSSH